ncbi:MAG TPA: hypothetical protein VGP94_01145 [Tepidisphaeraceae bacterium]|jgi:hypothetical protein|nr:hypothetical protein [Tepidisphaeraceae bacterium]
MSLKVTAQIVWAGDIPDQPGALAEKLGALAASGANLEFVIARRRPEEPGKGVVFVSPVQGKAAEEAATSSGLTKAMDVPTLRVEGPDQPGIGQRMLRTIADLGINLRGVSAAAIGGKFVTYIGFYHADEASRAAQALRGMETGKAKKSPARSSKKSKPAKRRK